jgi:hypothetical protein
LAAVTTHGFEPELSYWFFFISVQIWTELEKNEGNESRVLNVSIRNKNWGPKNLCYRSFAQKHPQNRFFLYLLYYRASLDAELNRHLTSQIKVTA